MDYTKIDGDNSNRRDWNLRPLLAFGKKSVVVMNYGWVDGDNSNMWDLNLKPLVNGSFDIILSY